MSRRQVIILARKTKKKGKGKNPFAQKGSMPMESMPMYGKGGKTKKG